MRGIAAFGLIVLAVLGGAVTARTAFDRATGNSDSAPDGPVVNFITSPSAISCASPISCLAVGTLGSSDQGTPAAAAWNGKAWRPVAVVLPAGTGGGLSGVSCQAGSCLAVGSYIPNAGGFTADFAVAWNGRTLRRIPAPPPPAGGEPVGIGQVSCVSARDCVTMVVSMRSGSAVIDTWDGATWRARRAADPAGVADVLSSISCVSATHCVFGGTAQSDPNSKKPLLASWDGERITPMKVPAPAATDVPSDYGPSVIDDVSCVSATSCVAVGTYLTDSSATAGFGFAEVLTGKTWQESTIAWPGGTSLSALFGVSCASARSCLAVGTAQSPGGSLAAAAATYNGKQWTWQTSPPGSRYGTMDYFGGVSCPTAQDCVAAGQAGTVDWSLPKPVLGSWNGQSWRLVTLK